MGENAAKPEIGLIRGRTLSSFFADSLAFVDERRTTVAIVDVGLDCGRAALAALAARCILTEGS